MKEQTQELRVVVLLAAPRLDPISPGPLGGLGPCDLHALRMALDLAGRHGGRVTAITAGAPCDETPLERALALGAHRAIRLFHEDISFDDLNQVASLLSIGLTTIGFDLILAGDRSPDWGSGATGPAVAHMLDLPHVTRITAVSISDRGYDLRSRRCGHPLALVYDHTPLLLTVMESPNVALVNTTPMASIELLDLAEPQDDDVDTAVHPRPTLVNRRPQATLRPTPDRRAEMVADAPELWRRLQPLLTK